MSSSLKLKRAIEEIIKSSMEGMTFTKKVHATLISVAPLKFRVTDKIFIYGGNCITPKYRVFTGADIGKEFVFQEDAEGQQFIYCYEATDKAGENGIPYSWSGSIECNLTGTCPDGSVTVTGGTITKCTHIKGEN